MSRAVATAGVAAALRARLRGRVIDASTTDRPSTPWTRASGSTTAPAAGSSPMAQVPTGWW